MRNSFSGRNNNNNKKKDRSFSHNIRYRDNDGEMPRLHYYFIGCSIVGLVYGVGYRRWYLPYTTYQREMELVLEAEKFVSQQLLQRAERLQRQISELSIKLGKLAIASSSSFSLASQTGRLAAGEVKDSVRRNLATELASVYALHLDFDNADVQTALPKSLYAARLSKMKRRCCFLGSAVLSREEPLSFPELLRSAAAYALFVLLYHTPVVSALLLASPSRLIESAVASAIARLLMIDVELLVDAATPGVDIKRRIVLIGKQEGEDENGEKKSADEIEARKVELARQKAKMESASGQTILSSSSPTNRRQDEIVSSAATGVVASTTSRSQQQQQRVISVVHAAHWIEEFVARFSLLHRPHEQDSVVMASRDLIVRSPASFIDSALLRSEDDVEILRPDFCWHGLPWFADFTPEELLQQQERNIVLQPITVSGVEQLLFNREEHAGRTQSELERRDADTAEQARVQQLAVSAEVQAALEAAVPKKPSEEDLLRRRRMLVDPTRVKSETAKAHHEAEIRELLYAQPGQQALSEMPSAADSDKKPERARAGENEPKFVEKDAVPDMPAELLPKVHIAGPLAGCGWNEDRNAGLYHKQKRPRVVVTVGAPCLPDALWHSMLRQMGATMAE